MAKTLAEKLLHPNFAKIHTVVLVTITGRVIGTFDKYETIDRYGHMLFSRACREGHGVLDVWAY